MLAVPAGFSQSNRSVAPTLPENSQDKIAVQTVLHVVKAAAPQVVVAAPTVSAAAGLNCVAGAATAAADEVQSPAAVNLNQPASCFNLRIAILQPIKTLAVQPRLQPAVTVVVVSAAVSFNAFNLVPGRDNEKTTAVLVLLVAFLAFAFAIKKKLSTSQSPETKNTFVFRPSLAQLVMLRC